MGRPNADELERRVEATSSGLGRRIDAERRPPILQRTVESATQPRSVPASQGDSTPSVRPSRPANSNNSNSSSSSSSQAASRATAISNAVKGAFARPQEP
jgi:hypothetical protein